MEYAFKTEPFAHQRKTWEETREEPIFAVFWEQGTGKSKLIIDTAAWLFEQGRIDALLVMAPNGVHRNWVTDEIPAHMPDRIPWHSHFYTSSKAKTKKHQYAINGVLQHEGLAILAMSYDALMTDRGCKVAKKFLTKRRCLYVADESQMVKSPGAKRTKRVIASGAHANYKRILTGTPVTQGALDVYSQMRFLDARFWKAYDMANFTVFKAYFSVWADIQNQKTGQSWKKLVRYLNLDELKQILSTVSSRVTKDEVLDLPPKLYSKRYVEMTPQQRRLYNDLRCEFRALLEDGEEITAVHALTRILRLQQIACGYLPIDNKSTVEIQGGNPRLKTLLELCDGLSHPCIIWARFRMDVDLIMQALGNRAVRYDGAVKDADRAKAKEAFQGGKVQYFVANAAAAGVGLTLHAARTVVYYSNSFRLGDRIQSEARAHRIGQEHPVHYVDLVVPDTVDERIVEALRNKLDIASIITGDGLKEWI